MSESSQEKTEEPTDKKFKDSLEEGQSFKFKEIIYLSNVVCVVFSLLAIDIISIVDAALKTLHNIDALRNYLDLVWDQVLIAFVVPVAVSIFSVCLPSMMQTKFTISPKALKLDFNKLNPVTGIKNIFSMKTIIELFKSIVVHVIGCAFIVIWCVVYANSIFELVYVSKENILEVLFDYFLFFVLLAMFVIFLGTTIFIYFEYRQFVKDLKMTKDEVKREQKDQNGNPEIKAKRTEFHRSLLSDQDGTDVKKSAVILANPTHLAIGVYFDFETAPIPMVSVKHRGKMALEVFKLARKNNIPIIRNKRLTQSIYKSNDRYTLILNENLVKVLYLLHWLGNIEYKNDYYDERDIDVW